MITCRGVIGILDSYLASELPEPERATFDAHLKGCPPCVAYLSTYQATIALGRGALAAEESPLPPMPPELVDGILAARRKTR